MIEVFRFEDVPHFLMKYLLYSVIQSNSANFILISALKEEEMSSCVTRTPFLRLFLDFFSSWVSSRPEQMSYLHFYWGAGSTQLEARDRVRDSLATSSLWVFYHMFPIATCCALDLLYGWWRALTCRILKSIQSRLSNHPHQWHREPR